MCVFWPRRLEIRSLAVPVGLVMSPVLGYLLQCLKEIDTIECINKLTHFFHQMYKWILLHVGRQWMHPDVPARNTRSLPLGPGRARPRLKSGKRRAVLWWQGRILSKTRHHSRNRVIWDRVLSFCRRQLERALKITLSVTELARFYLTNIDYIPKYIIWPPVNSSVLWTGSQSSKIKRLAGTWGLSPRALFVLWKTARTENNERDCNQRQTNLEIVMNTREDAQQGRKRYQYWRLSTRPTCHR